jgi:RNA polymerase sigma-70 factor, ECF subfamily
LNSSDAHIAAAIHSGDKKQFEAMFRSHYKTLCAFAFGFLKSQDEAEEVVQSVFIQFWEKRSEIMIDTSLKSYLYRAVRNASFNKLKHEKVRMQHVQHVLTGGRESISAMEDLEESELQLRIGEALKKLPEQCRKVFELSRFEELKYSEIAERLGISVKTVENQMGKALRIMREQLKDYLTLIALLMNGFLDQF